MSLYNNKNNLKLRKHKGKPKQKHENNNIFISKEVVTIG